MAAYWVGVIGYQLVSDGHFLTKLLNAWAPVNEKRQALKRRRRQ
jgi:hypothetical protein